MTQLVRLGVLGGFVLGMPALAVLTARMTPQSPPRRASASDLPTSPPAKREAVAESEGADPSSTSFDAAPGTSSPDQPFPTEAEQAAARRLQQQLLEAGATAFSLAFDSEARCFLAHCQVPLPASDSLSKTFQSRETRPIAAIRSVLHQVQQWQLRVARIQATRTQSR